MQALSFYRMHLPLLRHKNSISLSLPTFLSPLAQMMDAKEKWCNDQPCSDRLLQDTLQYCRENRWSRIITLLDQNPLLGVSHLMMDNHITTTILHQAITRKGDINIRAQVIFKILHDTPTAATLKNGYGSLPLHVCCQRNVKMNAATKEKLIRALISIHPAALVTVGGTAKRTPLHILFTDYVSPALTRHMIEAAPSAVFMREKEGHLPIHVACNRHCSPEKLRMLIQVYPQSLFEKTKKGETPLDLAESSATKAHPNFALLDELHRQMKDPKNQTRDMADLMQIDHFLVSDESSRSRLGSSDTARTDDTLWQPGSPSSRKRKYDETTPTSTAFDPTTHHTTAPENLLLHFAQTVDTSAMMDTASSGTIQETATEFTAV